MLIWQDTLFTWMGSVLAKRPDTEFRVLSERQKKSESILDSEKEVLPYIVFVFFFIFKLQFFSKKNNLQKKLFQQLQNLNFCFKVNLKIYG